MRLDGGGSFIIRNTVFDSFAGVNLDITLNSDGIISGPLSLSSNSHIDTNGHIVTFEINQQSGIAYTTLVSGHITGTGGLRKTGTGQLIMYAANDYQGTTYVDFGAATVSNSGTFGDSIGETIVAPDGWAIDYTSSSSEPFTLMGTGSRGYSLVGGNTNFSGPITLNGNTTLLVGLNSATTEFSGDISDGGAGYNLDIYASAQRTMILSGNNNYSGATTLLYPGTLLVNGTLAAASDVWIPTQGTLGGTGSIHGSVHLASGALLAPGDGIGSLQTGSLLLESGSTISVEIGTAGNDQLAITGSVNLNDDNPSGSTLALTIDPGFTPTFNSALVLFDNDGTDSIATRFNGLPNNGDTFVVDGHTLQIDYAGGDGNDITLTFVDLVAPTPVITSLQMGPTDVNPINVSVDFGEPVSGFVIDDLLIGNGAASNFATTDNQVYTIDVIPSANGFVTVDILAGAAADLAGNSNTVATSFSIEYQGNTAPVAQNVADDAVEDGPAITVAFNADDPDIADDPNTLTFQITSAPSEGIVQNNNDGTFTFDPGTDFQYLLAGETQNVTFDYTATDSHGAVSNTASITITVTGANDDPPLADAGGPYTVDEGSTIVLDGGGSIDPEGTLSTYDWDLDYDGIVFTADVSGVSPMFDASGIDGDATRTIALRVTNDQLEQSAIATQIVTISNVAPTAMLGKPAPSYNKGNETFKAAFDVSDVGINDVITAQVDYDFNDGLVFANVAVVNGKVNLQTMFPFTNQAFTKLITLRLSDGTSTSDVTTTLVVGSNGQDSVEVAYGSTIVTINGQPPVSFDPNGGLIIFGLDGDDTITVDGDITLDTIIDGGDGNDTLQGGGGRNTLIGGNGYDTVILASGQNTVVDVAEQTVIASPNSANLIIDEGATLNFSSSLFSNPVAAEIAWGDGMIESAIVNTTLGTVGGSHTYADDGAYNVLITLTDPPTATIEFSVHVVNVAPSIAAASFALAENSSNGSVVGSVIANDPGNDTLTYQIVGGTGASAFAINPATGEISVANSELLDFETSPSMTLEIDVADDDGGTATGLVTVDLLNQASITGSVFVDVNGNGLYDANEPGIDGVTVELLDTYGNAVLDENNHPITATTSDGGFFLFEDLDPNVYRLRENQPTGVNDGAEIIGSIGGAVVANDVMEMTLARTDADYYDFAEIGQTLTSGDTAGIGFWQNKHGQALITQGGTALATWLSNNFGNIFGDTFTDGLGDDGAEVAAFYKYELFKQKSAKSAGPAKVDAQFMATALATFFTSSTLAGNVAADYGFNVTATGIGTSVINVGNCGAAFNVANGTSMTIMQLLQATNDLTDQPNGITGAANIYDLNGDGIIDAYEASLRDLANQIYSQINEA